MNIYNKLSITFTNGRIALICSKLKLREKMRNRHINTYTAGSDAKVLTEYCQSFTLFTADLQLYSVAMNVAGHTLNSLTMLL